MPDSHKRRTLHGVAWNFLRVFGQTLLSLGAGIILARLLPPSDFGLLALAMVFIGFAELIASIGMGPAIVQRAQLDEQVLVVANTLSLIAGGLLFALCWLLAPALSQFFGDPRVADILRVLSIPLWASALAAVSRSLLIRQMNFRRLFAIDLAAYLLGHAAVSISLALLGHGVWSLVWGTTVSLLLQAAAALILSRPPLRLSLSATMTRELLNFGGGVSLNNTINYLAANVDYLTIGKFLSPTLLGLYTRAYQLVTMPVSKIAATLSGALFPSYAEIQQDRARLGRAYLKAVNATALVTFPILAGFAVAAETVIGGLYGPHWLEATPAFRTLALAGMLKAIFHIAGPIAQATGHIYAEVKRQTVYLITLGIGCLVTVAHGIEAVAWAVVLGSLWLYLAMAQLACRIVGCRWRDFFGAQLPGLALAAVVGLVQALYLFATRNGIMPTELRLGGLLLVSGLAGAWGFFYLPSRWIGPMPAWLCQQYAHKLPRSAQSWLQQRFPDTSPTDTQVPERP